MLPLVLDNVMAIGHYDAATQRFIVTSNTTKFDPVAQAAARSVSSYTGGVITSPEGQIFEIKVVGRTGGSDVEHLFATYLTDGDGRPTFTRVANSTIVSSQNNGPVSFSEDSESIVIYGVAGNHHFGHIKQRENDTRVNRLPFFSDSTDHDITSTSLVTLYEQVFTSSFDLSTFEATADIDLRMAKVVGTNPSSLRGRVVREFLNSSGTWTAVGSSILIGYQSITVANTTTSVFDYQFLDITLNTNQKNPSGDFQVRLRGEVDFADNRLLALNCVWRGTEYSA